MHVVFYTMADGTHATEPSGFFAYMMTHSQAGKRKKTLIAVARHPEIAILAHNIGLPYDDTDSQVTDTTTNVPIATAAPSAVSIWRPAIIVGPFMTREQCDEFITLWSSGRRNFAIRCDTARKLAAQFNVHCYTKRVLVTASDELKMLDSVPPPFGKPIRRAYRKMWRRQQAVQNDGGGERRLGTPSS
jgi:hypothetical protein